MSIHKVIKKSGPRYKAVVRAGPEKQLCRVFLRKVDAEKWEEDQKVLLRSSPELLVMPKMTVAGLAEYWIENYARQHKTDSSLISDKAVLKNRILPELGNRNLADLSPREVELWLNRIRISRKLAPKSCNHALGLLRKMLNDAVRWQFIRYNPISSVRPFRSEQQDFAFWTKEEAIRFLSHAKFSEQEIFPVFAVALYTGLRKGELRGLKWDCVHFDQKQMTIKRSFCQKTKTLKETTKSKKIRYVPINRSLLEVLVTLQANRTSEFVLPDFHYHHCYRVMQRLADASNVKAIRFHDLRHTFASHFMMAGGTIYDLQRLLGHSTIAMTERYSHMSPNHLIGKTEILDFGTQEMTNVVRLGSFRK